MEVTSASLMVFVLCFAHFVPSLVYTPGLSSDRRFPGYRAWFRVQVIMLLCEVAFEPKILSWPSRFDIDSSYMICFRGEI